MAKPRYRISEDRAGVSVELTGVAGHEAQLMATFGECQAGQCSCPTDEYQKLASMEVEQDKDRIRLRLEAKSGETFDASEIAACLDHTTAKVAEAHTQD